ncbi:MAG: hypothetical protein AAGG75_19760 [Bacteroidota bacterium]
MKKLSVCLLVLFATLSLNAQQSIEGIWNTGKENTKIEIKNDNSTIEGKIQSSDNPKAPVGELIVKDIQYKNGAYEGKLYAMKKKRWVDAIFTPQGDRLLITVSVGRRSRKIEWSAAN